MFRRPPRRCVRRPLHAAGRRSPLPGASPAVLLRVPTDLKFELEKDARREGRSINEVITRVLADGLSVPLTTNRKDTMSQQNGKMRASKDKVRVAIIGVGNCANSLLQGVEYYKDASSEDPSPPHARRFGGYHISDIEFTAAFDVVKGKVGVDLADAIWAHPNDTIKFADVKKTGVTVSRGMTHDGIGKYLAQVVEKAPATRTTWSASSRRPARTSSSTTCPLAPRQPRSGTPSRSSMPAWQW